MNRFRILWRFCSLLGKREEIEREWQKIQQDEHDEFFRFQIYKGIAGDQLAYKRGIVDGIKWCIDRFS